MEKMRTQSTESVIDQYQAPFSEMKIDVQKIYLDSFYFTSITNITIHLRNIVGKQISFMF